MVVPCHHPFHLYPSGSDMSIVKNIYRMIIFEKKASMKTEYFFFSFWHIISLDNHALCFLVKNSPGILDAKAKEFLIFPHSWFLLKFTFMKRRLRAGNIKL